MQILLAQGATFIGPHVDPASVSFANPTVSGNEIRVAIVNPSSLMPTVTDNKGNTYLQIGVPLLVNGSYQSEFYCSGIIGGAGHTVLITGSPNYAIARELVTGTIPNDTPLLQQLVTLTQELVNAQSPAGGK